MSEQPYQAVVVGTSAGALDALTRLLPPLPRDFPLPVIVVVHLPAQKESLLAELLGAKCKLAVREAEDKETLEAGVIYVAPPDYHLQVEQHRHLSLSSEEPVLFSRPSIDVLFETAADAYGSAVIGVVLTGASSDGAKGLKAICKAGGAALVQDPSTAYAATMPQSAIDACAGAEIMTIENIAARLQQMVTI